MDFNNSFKCRMGGKDLSHVHFNPKLWNLRPIVKDSGEAMRISACLEAYAHVKENQQEWLAGSTPLPDQCPRYLLIRRMLLGVTSLVIAPCIRVDRVVEERTRKRSEDMESQFLSWNVAAMQNSFDLSFS